MICHHYNAQVRVPPAGAEDKGCNVGDQALEILHAEVRDTVCQRQNLLLLNFKHGGSAAQVTDALTEGNSSWVRAMPLWAEDNKYTPISVNVASLS